MLIRILIFVALGGAALALGAGLAFRLVPMDPGLWHVDPGQGARTGRPNDVLVGPGGEIGAPVLAGSVAEVAGRLDRIALAEPRTERIAGTTEAGWMTYVQRSALMGYPDAVSVKAEAAEGGTRVLIWSRSRYGHSDLGVNRARVERWLAALQP